MTSRAVLFDFDGTLVDTMGDFADLAGRLFAAAGRMGRDEGRRAYLATSGVPFFQQLEILFPGHPENRAMERDFEQGKLSSYVGRGLLSDVHGAISALRAHGLRAVVSSNNFTSVVTEFLAGTDVVFDLVLGFGDGLSKGAPHFDRTSEVFGLQRKDLLFVGDSVRDAEIAREAGVRFVGRLGTVDRAAFTARFGPNPFPFVDDLSALLPIILGDRAG